METVTDFILGGSQKSLQMVIAAMKLRHLLFGRKVMTNLDSILKSRDITSPTNVHLVKAMVFAVVMYGCESVKVPQKCPTFYDPMDYTVHGVTKSQT